MNVWLKPPWKIVGALYCSVWDGREVTGGVTTRLSLLINLYGSEYCSSTLRADCLYVKFSRQPYSTYAIYTATFTSLGLVTDPLFFYLYYMVSRTWTSDLQILGLVFAVLWYLFTKTVKRVGLIRKNSWDLCFIPVSIMFGFAHGFVKLYALWTWNVVSQIQC